MFGGHGIGIRIRYLNPKEKVQKPLRVCLKFELSSNHANNFESNDKDQNCNFVQTPPTWKIHLPKLNDPN
jgi:hypothetical protein